MRKERRVCLFRASRKTTPVCTYWCGRSVSLYRAQHKVLKCLLGLSAKGCMYHGLAFAKMLSLFHHGKKAPAGQLTWKIDKIRPLKKLNIILPKPFFLDLGTLWFFESGVAPWVLQLRLTFTFRKAEMIPCGKPLWSEKREFAFIHMQNLVLRWFSRLSFVDGYVWGWVLRVAILMCWCVPFSNWLCLDTFAYLRNFEVGKLFGHICLGFANPFVQTSGYGNL